MHHQTAKSLIEKGLDQKEGMWADIGAGTGVFTEVLRDLLDEGSVYAVDKSPHALWRLPQMEQPKLVIEDANFTRPMNLPMFDGIIMANALHYTNEPIEILQNILKHLKKRGRFILVEYELSKPQPPWIPFPITFEAFCKISSKVGLSFPKKIKEVPSQYGAQNIYSVWCEKL
ncbi:MAG: class I SAM-dependent methyltransferase [Saprospiraceae bacterium]